MTPDVNVQLLNFPNSGHEMVIKNEDESYTILINAKLSRDSQIAAYQHALKHIQNGDFDREYGDIQEIETTAHNETTSVSAPAPAPISVENIKQQLPKRQKRRRNRKQGRYTLDRSEFIAEHYDSFALAEYQWLYGNDL